MSLIRRGLLVILSIGLFTSSLAGVAGAATYYVASWGDDAASGKAPISAWKTLRNVNSRKYSPGDRILFEAQEVFSGKLLFDATDGGTVSNPVTVSSFGLGRATIFAGNDQAVSAYNCGGIVIANINFIGAGPAKNESDGISFYNDLPNDAKLEGIAIDHVEVSGFGGCGVVLGGWNNKAGYRDVSITGVSSHDNLRAGIMVCAQQPNANADIYVAACKAYNNFGDPKAGGNTGSGIVLGGVLGGTVERCVVHDNGKSNFSQQEGAVGIWAYNSSKIALQFNESHHNRTGSRKDGGGFDLDTNVTNSAMQYNYSHDNEGPGFMLCATGSNSCNAIRFNISQNDARKNNFGALHLYGENGGSQIYNNTVFLSPGAGSASALALVTDTGDVWVRNNIFQTTDGARLLQIAASQRGLQMQGNDYFSTGAPFEIADAGQLFDSLDRWRAATGREILNGAPCGLSVNPKLTNPGRGGTLNNAWYLFALTAYKLQPTSLLIGAGINLLSVFNENPDMRDFFGTPIPQPHGFEIGAHELKY